MKMGGVTFTRLHTARSYQGVAELHVMGEFQFLA